FRVTLSSPSSGTTLGTATATATILNDDTSIAITTNALSKAEGLAGSTPFAYSIARRGNLTGSSSVSWSVTGSGPNPTDANDFTGSTSGILTFTPGQAFQVLQVNVKGDTIQEADESFTLTLSAATGAFLATSSSSGLIRNDDLVGDANSNTLIGTSLAEYINGGANVNILTGGSGADTFAFNFGQSPINTPDLITAFAYGTDKLAVLSSSGARLPAPVSFSRAAENANASTLADLAFSISSDSNGALSGNQILAANSAVIVRSTNAAIAGIYVMINDSVSAISATDDLMIKLGGITGGLPAVGAINPAAMFV
ncbi:MAG: bluetail domain-containing putative surface protein, partial [Cyanobacteriota bacterium]